jgi:hypothetical protein
MPVPRSPRGRLLCRGALSVLVLLVALLPPRPAHAQWSTDGPLLIKLLAQAQQTVSELQNIEGQLQQAYNLTKQSLTTRPDQELGYVAGIIKSTQNDYTTLVGSTQSIGYQVNQIHNAFAAMYPAQAALQNIPSAQYDALNAAAQSEVLASAEIAARAQTSLSQIQSQTEIAMQALQHSEGLETITGQIQLVLQLVGVMQADFTALIQNFATTGRTLSVEAAGRASGQQIASERTRRNRLNYKDRGASVPIPNKLP